MLCELVRACPLQRIIYYLQGDEATKRIEELRNRAIRDEKAAFSFGMKQGEAKGEVRGISIGKQIGEASGEKCGEARGVKRGILETAKNMLKNNIDIAIMCSRKLKRNRVFCKQ